MKVYFLALSVLLFVASCGNNPKNKIEGTDSQVVASGDGQQLAVDTV
ncbi:MAG: hypothetical protein RL662_161, partial [Bacteroidota bacterium]